MQLYMLTQNSVAGYIMLTHVHALLSADEILVLAVCANSAAQQLRTMWLPFPLVPS